MVFPDSTPAAALHSGTSDLRALVCGVDHAVRIAARDVRVDAQGAFEQRASGGEAGGVAHQWVVRSTKCQRGIAPSRIASGGVAAALSGCHYAAFVRSRTSE